MKRYIRTVGLQARSKSQGKPLELTPWFPKRLRHQWPIQLTIIASIPHIPNPSTETIQSKDRRRRISVSKNIGIEKHLPRLRVGSTYNQSKELFQSNVTRKTRTVALTEGSIKSTGSEAVNLLKSHTTLSEWAKGLWARLKKSLTPSLLATFFNRQDNYPSSSLAEQNILNLNLNLTEYGNPL